MNMQSNCKKRLFLDESGHFEYADRQIAEQG